MAISCNDHYGPSQNLYPQSEALTIYDCMRPALRKGVFRKKKILPVAIKDVSTVSDTLRMGILCSMIEFRPEKVSAENKYNLHFSFPFAEKFGTNIP